MSKQRSQVRIDVVTDTTENERGGDLKEIPP